MRLFFTVMILCCFGVCVAQEEQDQPKVRIGAEKTPELNMETIGLFLKINKYDIIKGGVSFGTENDWVTFIGVTFHLPQRKK